MYRIAANEGWLQHREGSLTWVQWVKEATCFEDWEKVCKLFAYCVAGRRGSYLRILKYGADGRFEAHCKAIRRGCGEWQERTVLF